jgi:hypothetical protein
MVLVGTVYFGQCNAVTVPHVMRSSSLGWTALERVLTKGRIPSVLDIKRARLN